MGTFAKPYMSGLRVNLHDFVAKQQGYNQQGAPITALGKQRPVLSVDMDLYLGDKNVGKQTYTLTEKAQPPTASHKGLPEYSTLVTDELVSVWETEIGKVIDFNMPSYSDDSLESAAMGPAVFPRINRIEASLPYGKPAEQYIAAVIGVYEDSSYSRQVIDADFVVLFCQDDFIVRQIGGRELAPDDISQLRSLNSQYSLKDFVSNQTVAQSVGLIAAGVFSMLKSQVLQWSAIDVEKIMEKFAIPVD